MSPRSQKACNEAAPLPWGLINYLRPPPQQKSLYSNTNNDHYHLFSKSQIPILLRRTIYQLAIIACIIICNNVSQTQQQNMISLEGHNWFVRNANNSIVVPAIVPGGIYTDLRRGNILKQDIFYGKNDVNYRWVGNENWTYTTTFIIDENIARSHSVKLVAHGLDTISTMTLNGQLVGQSDNMFVRYKFDIKPYLRLAGLQNILEITFESPIKYGARKSHQSILQNRGKIIPPYCPSPAQKGECHINFIRKMQASFSWDWGPAYPSVGIYKPIFIEFGNFGIIRDILVETRQAPPKSIHRPPISVFANQHESPISGSATSPFSAIRTPPYLDANNNNVYGERVDVGLSQPPTSENFLNTNNQLHTNKMDDSWLLKVTLVSEMAQPLQGYDMHIEFNLDNVLHYESDHMNVISNADGIIRLGFNLRLDHNKIRIKTWWPNVAGNQPMYMLQARISPFQPKPSAPDHIRLYPNGDGGISMRPVIQKRQLDNSDNLHYYNNNKQIITPTATEISEKTIKIGFRTVELIQEPIVKDDPDAGLTFNFRVNGIDMFAMGSNWIPAQILPELSSDREYLRYLLQSAKDANMNMLRVWGGGLYESDEFYQLADEMGIMIWHDLMFACALYPVEEEFLQIVRLEVEQQVQRLQHHPSIVLWAGNNENEVAISSPWWPEVLVWSKRLREMYSKLYVDTIKPIVQILDPTRPYLESSPTNGLVSQAQLNAISRNPNDNKYGDVHHYDYLSDSFEWTSYPSARFASEYGFQSYPSFGSMALVTNSSDWKYPLTSNILHRQHRLSGEFEIKLQIKAHFNEIDQGGVEKFKSFIYLSQLTQAIAVKTETEFYRRNRAVSAQDNLGHTMGALYWQLNDVWHAPTWASIEYGGKWKMLHYFARRFFFPIHLVPYLVYTAPTSGGLAAVQQVLAKNGASQQLVVDLVRDDLLDKLNSFNITIRLYRWSSFSPIWRHRFHVIASPLSVTRIYEQDLNKILKMAGLTSSSGGVFQVVVEQQPFIGLSQIENYLMPVIPARITGMRLPRIIIDQILGPFESLSYHSYHSGGGSGSGYGGPSGFGGATGDEYHSGRAAASNWACTYRITLASDSIAMFVWLDLNLTNLPPDILASLMQPLALGIESANSIHNIHQKGMRFQFSDNAFNMFEPVKVIDLYLDRYMTKSQIELALEIRSLANHL